MQEKAKDLRKKSVKGLYKDLKEAQDKLIKLKFEVVQTKLKNHREIPKTRKEIARILTIISEKQWEDFEKQQKGGKDEK